MPKIILQSRIFMDRGNGEQDEETFFSLAGEYLEAARILQKHSSIHVNCTVPVYFLLGHAAELLLKSFLYCNGKTIKDLRAIGHDLQSLCTCAQKIGLNKGLTLKCLSHISDVYKQKKLEYREKERDWFSNIDLLTNEVEQLYAVVYDELVLK